MSPIITRPSARGTAKTKREPPLPGTGALIAGARVAEARRAHEQVRALARAQRDGVAEQLARPHAGGVDDVAGAQLEAASPVRASRTRRAVGAQRARTRVGEDPRAVGGGGARERDDEPRVVLELAVPVQQRAAQPAVAERRARAGAPPPR